MKTVTFPSGERVAAFGMGGWNLGDDAGARAEEIATLRLGLDSGATLIDTAEMYGDGRSEELIAEAIAGRRDEVFLVSKVYPHNASAKGVPAACERSLRRLKTDRIDLYLLHWRGTVPLAETLRSFMRLKEAGKIRHYGVSNLDISDMQELWKLPGGKEVATNQLLYNLTRRGIEWDLLPWMRQRHLPLMAYSPIEQGRLIGNRKLAAFAQRNGMTPAQVALAWVMRRDGVVAIPKAGTVEHVLENRKAVDIALSVADFVTLDASFPAPRTARPLEML